ncbi:class I SAM-dependent methyltransferase [Emcibacter sp.]|uniref:class I SAM-dependent methyltransferase n=1 Tax=Emcibacter sp. TaxID=1979954 RepID=UPI003A8D2A6E
MSQNNPTETLLAPFSDPDAVAHYTEGPPRFVPGFTDLHKMTGILLAERVPATANILVLGAGGGLELKALAEMQPGWCFTGIDPAPEMLKLAGKTLGPLANRACLIEGYIDDAPKGPFDAAVCLLTLHFLDAEERRRTASEIHKRLKPDAPFVAAHSSFPQEADSRPRWLSRYGAFAVASGTDPEKVKNMVETVGQVLSLYSPEEDEKIILDAGFKNVEQFYAAFTWRGWLASA